MSGVKWQSSEDLIELGRRIMIHDEPHKRKFLDIRERLKDRLKGKSYSGSTERAGASDVLEFVANLEPALAAQLPDTEVYTEKGGAAYSAARGLHHAHRQWMVESKYELEILKSANDYAMGYAVRARGIGPRPGYEDEGVEWPWSSSVPLDQFGWDMRASSFEDAEYAYQVLRVFPHDLKETARKDNEGLSEGDPGWWDLDMIDLMEEDARKDGKASYYVVYLPKANPKELLKGEKHPERYKGVQLYLTASTNQKAEFTELRKATPHYGSNPYTVIGMQRIPDESMAVTVLALAIDQADSYNAIVASNSSGAAEYRNFGIVSRKKLGEMIQSSKHRHIYWDQAFNKDEYTTMEIGGLTEQQLVQESRAEEIYHRAVGQSESDRGALTPGAKATDLALASAASGARRSGQVNTFHRGIKADLEGILELLFYTDTVIVDLGPDAADEGQSVAPVFFGGDFDKKQIQAYYRKHYPDVELREEDLQAGQDVPLADLQLRLKMDSMGRKPKQEQMLEASLEMETMERTSAFLISNPHVDAKAYVRHVAKKTGFIEMPDFFDFAWVEMMRGMMVQGLGAGAPPAQGTPGSGTRATGPQTMVLPGQTKQLQPQNIAGGQSGQSATGTRNGAMASAMGGLA